MDNNLICIAGSDIHTNEDLNTFIKLKLDDPSNKTIENVFKNLRNNTHEAVAIQFFSETFKLPGDSNDSGLYIVEEFINYLLNIDICQALSWIIWSSIVYLTLALFYKKAKKVELKWLKAKIY